MDKEIKRSKGRKMDMQGRTATWLLSGFLVEPGKPIRERRGTHFWFRLFWFTTLFDPRLLLSC